jgi:nitrite reductase/ring-hydroxylating ferredoxin subunit
MKCNQCEVAMINGVFCHETGCPNTGKRYDAETETWKRLVECPICGYDYDPDNGPCCEPEY